MAQRGFLQGSAAAVDTSGMHARLLVPTLVVTTLVPLGSLACFEVPTLDEFEPPPPDLGSVETWGSLAGLDPGGSEGPDEGLTWGEGPGEGPSDDDGPADAVGVPGDPALGQLRISEVLIDPLGKDGGPESPEWVELVNPGPEPVALAGLRIDAASWPILDGVELGLGEVTLPVGGVLVVRRHASDVDPALAGVSVQGAQVFTSFLHGSGLRNADGRVAIGPSSSFADVLVYGAPSEPPFDTGWIGEAVATPEPGLSLCRSTIDAAPLDDHDDASDWAACMPSPGLLGDPGTPDEGETGESGETGERGEESGEAPIEPEPIAMGALVIVEVMSNPPGPAADEKPWEYVELINASANEVELAFVRIGDDPSPDAAGIDPLALVSGEGGCASPTCLAPGRRALIVAQGYLGETGEALVLATDDSTIADGGLTTTEPVVIWDGFDAMISSYRVWPDPSAAPLPSDEQPLHRADLLALDEPSSWSSSPATPGT